MPEHARPDPDALLRSLKEDEREKNERARLKIFFGMAAGVGKTYAMLEAAHRLAREGIDVVVGYVETHGRVETEDLVKGLQLVPRKRIDYRGIVVEEFDIDTVIERQPAAVLVDELAHTNAVGSRHSKRYQDVQELLDNGIAVYTTLNVQHLESQADIVEKITGVKIRETIPDSMLDLADEVELVDIPPEELLKRLAEGKVYVPEKAGLAAERFFRKGNITALREMALHYTARLVGYELRHYTEKKNIKGPWKSGERLLVAVSPSPYSEYLIRWTRRIAFNLNAPWIALYIDRRGPLSGPAQKLLNKNLALARELGAEVLSTADDDIINGLLRVALQKNITQIVVGKPLRRYFSDYLAGGNLVERLLKSSGDIEIHMVTQPDVTKRKPGFFSRLSPPAASRARPKEYVVAAAVVAAVTLVNLALVAFTGYWTIGLMFLLCVALLSLYVGRWPVMLAAVLSALSWNFLFIPPLYTFRIGKLEDAVMFGMYFMIASIVGGLTSKLRLKERALRAREERISDLYEFSRGLSTALGIDEVVSGAVAYIEDYFDSKVAVMLSDESTKALMGPHISSSLEVSADERGVAEWAFKNRQPAGLFTDTLPQKNAHYFPLAAQGRVMGVMGIRPPGGMAFSLEQRDFLNNITSQFAMRIERENLSAVNQKALMTAESERLHKLLLNSISHELRTPLTAITGAADGLMDDTIVADPKVRRALAVEIKQASLRLNRIVENLLDMSRIESGRMKLRREMHDVMDLVSVVLRDLEPGLEGRSVSVDADRDLPMACVDLTLMEQVLANLVHNAIAHTPPATRIKISVSLAGDEMMIIVEDNGPGFNDADIPRLFDKFYRGAGAAPGGTGLGLSICRGIVDAHGGRIVAANRPGGGAVITVRLPLGSGAGNNGGCA